MAKVDKLEVEIVGDVKGLTDSLDRAVKETKQATDKMGGAFSHLNSGLGKVATGFGAFGLAVQGAQAALAPFQGVVDQLNQAQGLSLMARRLGLSTEQMQKFGFAARLSGSDSETLADAMKDLTVKIKDASLGATSYEEALNLVGLKSQDLVNLPVDQQFLKFADAISQADEATKRFVLDEINDSMFQLLPLLDRGSKGIEEFGDKVSGALSDQQVEALKGAASEVERMAIGFENMASKLAATVAPLIESIAGSIADITENLNKIGSSAAVAGAPGGQPTASGGAQVGQGMGVDTPEFNMGGPLGQFNIDLPGGGQATVGTDQAAGEDGGLLMGVPNQGLLEAELERAQEFWMELELAEQESRDRRRILEAEALSASIIAEQEAEKQKLENKKRMEALKMQAYKDSLAMMSSLMNTENRKMFEVGKAAAIAQTLINTYQSVTKAMAEVPYPANFAVATAALASGLNNVNNIRSTQFGSAGSGAASTGGAPGVGAADVAPAEAVQTTNFDVTLQGESFTGDQVRGLIGLINDETDDGVKLNTVSVV